MAITPEQARAELARRKSTSLSTAAPGSAITPEMARAELDRRRSLKPVEKIPESAAVSKPEEEGFVDYAKRGLARHARNAVVGPLDTLDFLATPVRAALNLGAKALGSQYEVPALGEETAKSIDTMTGGYTAPRNASEKTGEAIVRAGTSLPSGLALGTAIKGVKNIPNVLKGVGEYLRGSSALTPTNMAATGATSGLIQSSLNENPEDIVKAVSSGTAGGVGVPAAVGALSALTKGGRQKAAARTGEFFKVNPQAVETFEKAGITPMLADVSEGKIPKLATSKLEHLPFSAEPIRKAKELQRKQVMEGLGQGEFGRNLSKAEAANLVAKGAKKYQRGKTEEFGKKFDKVEKDIESFADDNVGIENTTKYFDSFLKNMKTPSQVKRFQESPLGKMYVDLYETATQNNGKIPYHDMKERLDQINDLITTHGLIGKVSQGKLKQFASNVTRDIEQSMEPKFKALGEDAYNNWKEVKRNYAGYAQEEIPKLNEIFKKDKKGATEAFTDLMANQKKGAEKAKIALQGLSAEDQVDLMDAVNKNLGAKSDGSFSPLVWVRKFKALEPESQKVLLSPLNKSSQEKVKYISESIDKIKETLEQANTSKTDYHRAIGALWGSAGSALAVAATTGNVIPAATLATGLFMSNRISEKMLTNPKFINWMYKGMKAKDLGHFERNLERVPKVGKFTKTLQRSVQTFQHELHEAHEKRKEKKE